MNKRSTSGAAKDRGQPRQAERRPIKVTPRCKKEIDPHLVALVYFLIASRIVRDATESEATAERSSEVDRDKRSEARP
jgi:hypothetical protein